MRSPLTAASVLLIATCGSSVCAGEAPTIMQQPFDRAVCAGSQATFSVVASGNGQLTFEWQTEAAPRVWVPVVVPPREGVWERISIGVDEAGGSSTLCFGWIGASDTRRYRCIVSDSIGSTVSGAARLTALTADFGGVGGDSVPDAVLDNNDFVVCIDAYFSGDERADLGTTGGQPGGDGRFDNNDFVVFIDLFFNGCIELH